MDTGMDTMTERDIPGKLIELAIESRSSASDPP